MPIQQNPPGGRFVEPGNQLGEGRFAHAGRADQRQHFPGPADERDILQHGNAVFIGKADMIKGHLALNPFQRSGIRAVLNLQRRVQHIQNTLRPGH